MFKYCIFLKLYDSKVNINDKKKKDVLYIFTGYYYKKNKIINSQKNELCLSKVRFYRVSETQGR